MRRAETDRCLRLARNETSGFQPIFLENGLGNKLAVDAIYVIWTARFPAVLLNAERELQVETEFAHD
jgi:hypothetical protein